MALVGSRWLRCVLDGSGWLWVIPLFSNTDTQMVREIVVRVFDFAQCENLKRGQENRGHAASKKIDKGKLLSADVYFSILPGCSNNGHHHMHAVSMRVEEIPGAQYERSQVV